MTMSQREMQTSKLLPRFQKGKRSRHTSSPRSSTVTNPSHAEQETADDRQKRVRKACERCRARKTKCGSEFPCKRCKNDGAICTGGARRKTAWKKLSPEYVEVLENAHLVLVATVHKLYAMARSGQKWDLGEPGLNDRDQPVVHNIAFKLGCLQLHKSTDLPARLMCPENELQLAELAAHLETQEREHEAQEEAIVEADETDWSCDQMSRASSSELDQSDLETDAREDIFSDDSAAMQSPQGLDNRESQTLEGVHDQPSIVSTPFPNWVMHSQPAWMQCQSLLQLSDQSLSMYMPSQGMLDFGFGSGKSHMLSGPKTGLQIDMEDTMFGGYDN